MKKPLLLMAVACLITAASAHAILIPHDGEGDDYYVGNGQYLLPGPLGNPSSEAAWVSGILGKTVTYDESVLAKLDGLVSQSQEFSWDLTGLSSELCAVLLKSGNARDGDLRGQLYRIYVPGDEAQKIAGIETLETTFDKDLSHLTPLICRHDVPDGGATLALLGLGLAGVVVLKRRKA